MRQYRLDRNLKALRTARPGNMSREELAGKIGVASDTVRSWETGEHAPAIMHAAKIADIFGVTLDQLCFAERLRG